MVLRAQSDGSLDGGEAPGAAWNARGRTLMRVGRPVEASTSFRRAVACGARPVYESNAAIRAGKGCDVGQLQRLLSRSFSTRFG